MNWVHLIPVDSFQVGVNRLFFKESLLPWGENSRIWSESN